MRPFGEAKSISGHQTLQLRKRPYGVKGSVYVVTLPALQRCLEDGPDAAERRPRSGFPTSRGTGDGHLEAHHDLQATPARPRKVTRLGVRGSIVPAASRTSYSSFYKENKQRIEQLALGASVFLLHRERLNKLIARSRTNTYSLNIEELACGHNRGMSSDLRLWFGGR